jgi:hypothetical protein
VPVPWRNCGTPGDAVTFQQIDASVWPPQADKPLTLADKFTLSETLTKGSFEELITTTASGQIDHRRVPFESPVATLFGDALLGHRHLFTRTSLPLLAGPYNETLTFNLPKAKRLTSAQPITVDLNGYDAAGRPIVCMQLTVPVK